MSFTPARMFPDWDTTFRPGLRGFLERTDPAAAKKGRPLLWLFNAAGRESASSELWLQNGLEEELAEVVVLSASWARVDDVLYGAGRAPLVYSRVKPGEAVRLDCYDLIYDSDSLFEVEIDVLFADGTRQSFRAGPEKGGIGMTVLVRAPAG